ncbi:MAG: TerB family tellurite resistance protein [Cellvibrionaceae bacterium]
MIAALEKLFERLSTDNDKPVLSAQDLHLATAALLVEVATIDQNFDEQEWKELQQLLMVQCELNPADAEALANQGKDASSNSSSLYEFTQLINKHCDYSQKIILVEGLWKIAFADGSLDKYEEHIIRRIADLIHVSHRDFIQAKIKIREISENV